MSSNITRRILSSLSCNDKCIILVKQGCLTSPMNYAILGLFLFTVNLYIYRNNSLPEMLTIDIGQKKERIIIHIKCLFIPCREI